MKPIIAFAAALTLGAASTAAAPLAAAPLAAAPVDKLYAFGDSLNDCCFSGPFTNGPNSWLVEFSGLLGADYPTAPESAARNYAIGGAQSGAVNAIPLTDAGFGFDTGLLSQVSRFEASGDVVDGQDLAVIWVGTNDIWPSGLDGNTIFGLPVNKPVGDNPSEADLAAHVAGNIGSAVARLRDEGFGQVLVLTPFDVGDANLIDTPVEATGRARNTAYSEAVRDALTWLYTPGVDTFVLDMVALIRELQAGAPGNGFTFLTGFEPCEDAPGACAMKDDSQYIFNDFVHLTTTTNSIVAERAAALVMSGATVQPVPLPAGVGLLVAGVASLVVAGRRKAG